ncbi:transcriptional regulator [Siphonobacter sp. BAB-5385]|uniref:winged helix-turn-helix transcriptional regulator n=1 Tax=unclassified Siphonobacter TaxID=2635712 RepID=UPI000B9E1CA7|nr:MULTISPECIES: helix-turn-helix domain-containing protein [unclassified Siphonobacter]OZI09782.1 transcriptional regulator [Siphonobacter sp. BAB-5385]PMD92571.1 transcriptional regulator [Siphonobacter sp. BAB-5405]
MKSTEPACQYELKVAKDAMEVIQGKWRIPIIISLTYGNKRFGEIQRDIPEISPKMLSQELKALEENQLITRTLYDSMPVTVEYALTPLGLSMKDLLVELRNWGKHFRKEIVGK